MGKPFTILVATDGSAAARAAVTTAIRFPWPEGVRAFGVVATQTGSGYRQSLLRGALQRTADSVAERTTRAMSRRWPDATVRVAPAPPVDAILREAARHQVAVIVMGWRGHAAVRRLLAGSVSRGVVRRAPCAVLVVRRPVREVRQIVIGFDGSPHARRAVDLIAHLDPPRGARVTLVTSVDTMLVPFQALVPTDTRTAVAAEVKRINAERLARARKDLAGAAKSLTAAGWKVDSVVTEGAPLSDLLAAAARTRADILVLGARGVSGLRHMLLGSVAEGALNRSPLPVLIVR